MGKKLGSITMEALLASDREMVRFGAIGCGG